AIRRAVSEQINALKELSEIVAKSGRSIDVSEPRGQRPSALARAAEPQRRTPAPTAQPARSAPQAPAGGADLRGTLELERPADAARPSQGGWVRDLLTGASQEEARPAA